MQGQVQARYFANEVEGGALQGTGEMGVHRDDDDVDGGRADHRGGLQHFFVSPIERQLLPTTRLTHPVQVST